MKLPLFLRREAFVSYEPTIDLITTNKGKYMKGVGDVWYFNVVRNKQVSVRHHFRLKAMISSHQMHQRILKKR